MIMIPFSPPFIDNDVLEEVKESLTSGWITTGPKVKQLEEIVAKISDRNHVVAVNSATSGLMVALKWFGVGPGDEVIVPAYTYSATALAVLHLGAKPVIVDVKDDFTIDPQKIFDSISDRTKAIIPVDVAGWPADYDSIYKITEDIGVKNKFSPSNKEQEKLGRVLILSDAAHSIGARYKGKPTGKLADITIFSFHAVKNVTTAEGGAVILNLPRQFNELEEYNKFRLMILNGQTKDAYTKTKAGGWKYDIVLPGFKMNMPDVLAAIGLAQIRKYKDFLLPERKRIALKYENGFKKYLWAKLPQLRSDATETSYHIYPLRVHGINEAMRDAMIELISKSKVAVNVHFIPLPMLSLFKELGYDISNYPIAYRNYSCEISLPIYPQLTNEQIDIVINSVVDAYNTISL
jgi:dTDP-4-amino-4,6-dideoxygalactose transaminase